MGRRDAEGVLGNLCDLSRDMADRLKRCEQRGYESARVGYDDLLLWFDCVGDAIVVVDRGLHGREG